MTNTPFEKNNSTALQGNKEEQKTKQPKSAPDDEQQGFKDAGLLEPTRFGDWEVKGRCSDF